MQRATYRADNLELVSPDGLKTYPFATHTANADDVEYSVERDWQRSDQGWWTVRHAAGHAALSSAGVPAAGIVGQVYVYITPPEVTLYNRQQLATPLDVAPGRILIGEGTDYFDLWAVVEDQAPADVTFTVDGAPSDPANTLHQLFHPWQPYTVRLWAPWPKRVEVRTVYPDYDGTYSQSFDIVEAGLVPPGLYGAETGTIEAGHEFTWQVGDPDPARILTQVETYHERADGARISGATYTPFSGLSLQSWSSTAWDVGVHTVFVRYQYDSGTDDYHAVALTIEPEPPPPPPDFGAMTMLMLTGRPESTPEKDAAVMILESVDEDQDVWAEITAAGVQGTAGEYFVLRSHYQAEAQRWQAIAQASVGNEPLYSTAVSQAAHTANMAIVAGDVLKFVNNDPIIDMLIVMENDYMAWSRWASTKTPDTLLTGQQWAAAGKPE